MEPIFSSSAPSPTSGTPHSSTTATVRQSVRRAYVSVSSVFPVPLKGCLPMKLPSRPSSETSFDCGGVDCQFPTTSISRLLKSGSQRVIQDIIPSLTPHNGILSQFQEQQCCRGMMISIFTPVGSSMDRTSMVG